MIYGVSRYMKRNGVEGLRMVQNIRKRIGQTVIYGESRYMKRNGLDGWVSIVRVETSGSPASEKEREIGITGNGE